VAGYDLFNEPNGVDPMAQSLSGYTAFLSDAVAAIRAGEREAGGFEHIVFVEPIVLFPLPDTLPTDGFVADDNLAFAPHNYWESISPFLTVEAGMELDQKTAAQLGMPFWVGEYGWWDTGAESVAELRRYAAAEDAAMAGGAWWQWRQACGDPHSIGMPRGVPDDQIHLNGVACPSGRDRGLTHEFARVLGRPYPRAAPGTLTSLSSDVDSGRLRLSGTAGPGSKAARLVVWSPGEDEPTVGGTNVSDVEVEQVRGGFLVRAIAGCSYELELKGSSSITGDPASC
jgi:endoglycosylceramidase